MIIIKAQKSKEKRQTGQSLVEFALILPVLLLMLLGIFEVGWALRGYLVLVNINREAARFAARGVYLDFTSQHPDPLCPGDVVGEGYCPTCTGGETLNVGYCKIISHTVDSLIGQLSMDFSNNGNAAMFVTYYDLQPITMDDISDCSVLSNPNHPNFEDYTQVAYPHLVAPSAATISPPYTYSQTITSTNTISRGTHYYRIGSPNAFSAIDPARKIMELRAETNVLNCELKKKGQPIVGNNAIIIESVYLHDQLVGLPFVTAFVPDPVPMYSHTTMRVSTNIREQQSVDEDVCELYPMIIPSTKVPYSAVGTQVDIEVANNWSDISEGKLSFIYWDPTQPPQPGVDLQNPDNTENYRNADNLSDNILDQLDWVAATPGDHEAEVLNELQSLQGGSPLRVPIWNDAGCVTPPCGAAQDKSGSHSMQMFTFVNLTLVNVDYSGNPAVLTFEYLGPDPSCGQ